MINETLVSFKDLFKSKIQNPFFGTLATVWVIHNWDLVYSLFHFEKNLTREMRIGYIEDYFTDPGFLGNMILCVLIAMAVLVASYVLLNVSKLIVNTSKDIVGPYLQGITDMKKIVTKEEYKEIQKERDRWQKKYEVERNRRFELLSENEELEKKLAQTMQLEIPDVDLENDSDLSKIMDEILDEMEDSGELAVFDEMIADINRGISFLPSDEKVKKMAKRDLIDKGEHHTSGHYYYKFTEFGGKLKDYHRRRRNHRL